MQEEETLSP